LTGAKQLISYDIVLAIAREAVQVSEDDLEISWLKQLIEQDSYAPMTSDYLWQCPSFRAQFQRRYPDIETFRILENYLINPTNDTKFAVAKLAVPYQQFSLNDPISKIDEQQLTQLKPFNFANYLKNRQQLVTRVLSRLVLVEPDELLAAIDSVLTSILSSTVTEQQIKAARITTLFQLKPSMTDYAAFYQRLFNNCKDNPHACLLIASSLVESSCPRLLPLQMRIAAQVFPEEDETEGLKRLQESSKAMLDQLSTKEIPEGLNQSNF
jgi:hypothetical protein